MFPQAFPRRDVDEILEGIRRTRRWYESTLGYQTQGTILNEVESRVRALSAARESRTEKTLDRADLYAVLEGSIFSKIHRGLSSLSSDKLPRGSLKRALGGTLAPQSEDRNSNVGRNHRFELEIAAELLSSGLDVTGFDDVQFTFEGLPLTIQCKRPFRPAGVRENLQQAWRQVKKRVEAEPGKRGLIMISVERVYDPTPERAEILVVRLSKEFQRQYQEYWESEMDSRVAAIILAFKLLAPGGAKGHLAEMVDARAIIPFSPGDLADLQLLSKLEERLSS